MLSPSQLVQKLWNYCNILRDDGLSFRSRLGMASRAAVEANLQRAARLRQSILQKAFEGKLA